MDFGLYAKDAGGYFRTYIVNPLVEENPFISMEAREEPLPTYAASRPLLPTPIWDGHDAACRMYDRCWEIAFANLRRPQPGSKLIRNYIDAALNSHLFMWDTAFMSMFGRYAQHAFDFQGGLDNFYHRQHPDGFICREFDVHTSQEQFHRYDPSGTGPNLFAWAEWAYYCQCADKKRLAAVYPCIAAYHRFLRQYRTWQDGTYYATGWGCGMDNQPRFADTYQFEFFHGFLSWIDITAQQLLSARTLVKMAGVLGREDTAVEFAQEADLLQARMNAAMWHDELGYYVDKMADGRLSDVMTIGAYWLLLADGVPKERLPRFISHLNDPASFCRPHRVPTLAARDKGYQPDGGYWQGGVWSPTNYMVLCGLRAVGDEETAYQIAANHYENVLDTFCKDGTVYENYAPEHAGKGSIAAPEFVGWTGLSGINILLEYVLGIHCDAANRQITWHVRHPERHGITGLPLGEGQTADLLCAARENPTQKPEISIRGAEGYRVEIIHHADGAKPQ